MKQLERCFLCGRKECEFLIRSLLQEDLGTIMREKTSASFGIN